MRGYLGPDLELRPNDHLECVGENVLPVDSIPRSDRRAMRRPCAKDIVARRVLCQSFQEIAPGLRYVMVKKQLIPFDQNAALGLIKSKVGNKGIYSHSLSEPFTIPVSLALRKLCLDEVRANNAWI